LRVSCSTARYFSTPALRFLKRETGKLESEEEKNEEKNEEEEEEEEASKEVKFCTKYNEARPRILKR
jgi:hypothetical protein|tara:strand:- start:942 stop:1142 length:201 start_codon:yes stop_codon:yes gene_type:complete